MELAKIPGVGEAKAERLHDIGVKSAEDLASLDLRRVTEDVPGWTRDGLRKAKQSARRALAKEGVPFEKAPYGTGKPRAKAAAKPRATPAVKPRAAAAPAAAPAVASPTPAKKKGLLKRLLRKS